MMHSSNRPRYYVLDERKQARPASALEAAQAMAGEAGVVARTELELCRVSTVFLGWDHRFSEDGPPILFETMVFVDDGAGGEAERGRWRYSTWAEAEVGHMDLVEAMREELAKLAHGAQEAAAAALDQAALSKPSPAGPGG